MKSEKPSVQKNKKQPKASSSVGDNSDMKKKKQQNKKEVKTKTRMPTIAQMLITTMSALKKRQGVSRAAIVKHLSETYQVKTSPLFNSILRKNLKANVENGILSRKGNTFKLCVPKKASLTIEPKKASLTVESKKLPSASDSSSPPIQVVPGSLAKKAALPPTMHRISKNSLSKEPLKSKHLPRETKKPALVKHQVKNKLQKMLPSSKRSSSREAVKSSEKVIKKVMKTQTANLKRSSPQRETNKRNPHRMTRIKN